MAGTTTSTQTKGLVIVIIIMAAAVRLLCQMTWPAFGDIIYFTGRDFFDWAMVFALGCLVNGWIIHVVKIMLALAIYNLVKPLFIDPSKLEFFEYGWFFFCLLLTIIHYVFKSIKDIHPKHT